MTRARFKPWLALALLALPLLLTGFCRPWGRAQVPAEAVWSFAQMLGERHGIDPVFIYDIAFAESSFNANASTARARGLMQMTRPAWDRVSDSPFHQAWDWRHNMSAAVAYMDLLRARLERNEAFSYPMLAAAYHFGPQRVADTKYDMARLPDSDNKVYKALFDGRNPEAIPLPPGVDSMALLDSKSGDKKASDDESTSVDPADASTPDAQTATSPTRDAQPRPEPDEVPPSKPDKPLETPPLEAA